MKVADQAEIDDVSRLVAIEGMTSEQFASKTAVIGSDFEGINDDDVPGSLVLRADYDTVYEALAKENPEFAALTNANRSIADAMQFIANGARVFSRSRSLEPNDIVITTAHASSQTLVLKIARNG